MKQKQLHSLHHLCSAPIQALMKTQMTSSHITLKNIKSMFNGKTPKYLKLGKFKIPLIDFMQNSMMNIEYADLEFGIDVHGMTKKEIFGTYAIKDNPHIRFKIRIKREQFFPKIILKDKS